MEDQTSCSLHINPFGYPALKIQRVKNLCHFFFGCERVTLLETRLSQKEIHLPTINFQGRAVSFREGNHIRMGLANQLDRTHGVPRVLHVTSLAGLGLLIFFANWETHGCLVSLVLVFLYVQSMVNYHPCFIKHVLKVVDHCHTIITIIYTLNTNIIICLTFFFLESFL